MMSNSFKIIRAVCTIVLLVSALLTVPVAAADEYDQLRVSWLDILFGTNSYSLPITDQDLQAKIDGMDAAITSCPSSAPCTSGTGIWDLMNRDTGNRTYLWADADFTHSNASTNSGHFSTSYARLLSIATLYYTPGSALYQNATLKNDVISGLDWLYNNKYNTTVEPYGNWYHWHIGAPLALTKITALMKDDLTSSQINNYMNAVNRFVPDPYARTVQKSQYSNVNQSAPTMTGGNLADQASSVALRGMIVKDATKIAGARDSLSDIFPYVTTGDGFYGDGSFIQHQRTPYIGAYGSGLLSRVGQLMHVLDGSTWQVTDSERFNFYKWVFDSVEDFIYNGQTMDMVRGRSIAFGPSISTPLDKRNNFPQASPLISSAGYVLLTAPSDNSGLGSGYPTNPKQAMKNIFAEWLLQDVNNSYQAGASIYQYLQAKSILNDASVSPRGELIQYKQFSSMDRAVFLRPGFGVGLSMSSSRTSNYTSGNTNNVQGWYTGDGMTYLFNADHSAYYNYWPTVNRYRIPGTTVDTQTRSNAANFTNYVSPKNWVGGVELAGLYGASGMDYKASGDMATGGAITTPSNLVAKKSWFMFDDEIVALGAGITNSGQSGNGWDALPRRVETVIENRQLNAAGNNDLTVDGVVQPGYLDWTDTLTGVTWAHLQGNTGGSGESIGYYFPVAVSLNALRESRTGSWSEINLAYPATKTIAATADSTVRPGHSNQGTSGVLEVKNDGGNYLRESYLKFDLGNFVPGNTNIDGATIEITPSAVGPTGNAVDHRAELATDDSWAEAGIIWDNKPGSTALNPAQAWSSLQNGVPISIDVTDAVRTALDSGNKIISLRIYSTSAFDSDGWVQYAAREHANSNYRPKLVLSGYKENITENYLAMTTNHGTNPSSASYTYVLLPNKDSSETASYSNNPDIQIVSNTGSVQSVQENSLGITAANFFSAGTAGMVTSQNSASVMVQEEGNVLTLAVSDPTQQQSQVTIELDREGTSVISQDPEVSVLDLSPRIVVQINTASSAGKTFEIKLQVSNTQILAAAADAYVRPGYSNQGSGSTLQVKNDAGNYVREAFIKFDLTNLTSASADINTANIQITPSAVGPTANTIQHVAELVGDNSWTEAGIVWNNKPSATPLSPIQQWTSFAVGQPVSIDVTNAVKAALDAGSDAISLRVYATSPFDSDAWCDYAAREHGISSYRPKLVVTEN